MNKNDIITKYREITGGIKQDKVTDNRIFQRLADMAQTTPFVISDIINGILIGEDFVEQEHPRDSDGKFTDKRGKINSFKNKLRAKIQPKKEIQEIQKQISENVTSGVWKAIDDLGIRDKIHDVAMQGSFEKGTDLPSSGSDLDMFVIFKTNISENQRNELGLKIGNMVLNSDSASKNGWTEFRGEDITATGKYREAYFKQGDQQIEVQIVPTRHLTLEQIKNKEIDGHPINIGMERTPHQTAYMKKALNGKEPEVRMLKQFMKDTKLYDSSMKSQGFSGYSAEVLIDKFDTFEKAIDFFADLKRGDIVDKHGDGKPKQDNIFSLIDPIDPNRDLISAFSPMKIGRTIKTAKYFKEHGTAPPPPSIVELQSVTVSYNTNQTNEDTLVGQVRKSQNALIDKLNFLGFNVEIKKESVNNIEIPVPRAKMNDPFKENGKTEISFGTNSTTIPPTYKDKGVPIKMKEAVDKYREINKNSEFVEEDGRLKAIKKRPFTNIADALKFLVTNNLQKNGMSDGVISDMKRGINITLKDKDEFENMF